MKYAAVVDHISDDALAAMLPPRTDQPSPSHVERVDALLKNYANQIPGAKPASANWCKTFGVWLHSGMSESDVTIGVMGVGDVHVYTECGRKACRLKPGTVYLLHNKKPHLVLPANKIDRIRSDRRFLPLVFATMDVMANYADAYRVLVEKGETK